MYMTHTRYVNTVPVYYYVIILILGANRRISCKDLGGGDCQGWLYKRREGGGLIQSKWVKRWFVLKEKDLYYYKDQEVSTKHFIF